MRLNQGWTDSNRDGLARQLQLRYAACFRTRADRRTLGGDVTVAAEDERRALLEAVFFAGTDFFTALAEEDLAGETVFLLDTDAILRDP